MDADAVTSLGSSVSVASPLGAESAIAINSALGFRGCVGAHWPGAVAVACVLSSVASSAAVRTSASDIVGSVLWCGGVCGAFVLLVLFRGGRAGGPVSFRDVKELKINQSAWFYYNTPSLFFSFCTICQTGCFVKPRGQTGSN